VTFALRRWAAILVIVVSLDFFVTYHSWWQRLLAMTVLAVCVGKIEAWACRWQREHIAFHLRMAGQIYAADAIEKNVYCLEHHHIAEEINNG